MTHPSYHTDTLGKNTPREVVALSLIIKHCPELVRVVDDTLLLRRPNGSWGRLGHEWTDRHLVWMFDIAMRAEGAVGTADYLEGLVGAETYQVPQWSSGLKRSLASLLPELTGVKSVQTVGEDDVDDYQRNPLLPIVNNGAGGALSISKNTQILTAVQYANHMHTTRRATATAYVPGILDGSDPAYDPSRRALQHYPPVYFDIVAFAMAYQAPKGFVVLTGDKDTGKTTFFKWAQRAIGLVDINESEDLARTQWTPAEISYVDNILTVFDEADDEKTSVSIAYSMIGNATADRVRINRKHAETGKFRRRAMLVLMGNGMPSVAMDTIGTSNRLLLVSDDSPPWMDPAFKDQLLNDHRQHEYLLAWLVRRSGQLKDMGYKAARNFMGTYSNQAAMSALISVGRSEFHEDLDAAVTATGDPGDVVIASDVARMAKHSGYSNRSKEYGYAIKAVFGGRSKKIGDAKGWRGFKLN